MLLSLLFENPALFIGWVIALIISIAFHEFSHALVANSLGDPTPKYEGRLTLNPLAHLDPLGTVLLLIVGFGWGKPVPFNPYNLKYQRFGPAMVAAAGPISNFVLILLFVGILRILLSVGISIPGIEELLVIIILLNTILMLFNLIPIAPLDGSKVLYSILPMSWENLKENMERYGPMILLGLIIIDRFAGFRIFERIYQFGVNFVGSLF